MRKAAVLLVLLGACTVPDKFLSDGGSDDVVDAGVDAGTARFTVTIDAGGNGSGTVTSEPAGLDCGTDCAADFDVDTSVTLTATADADSTFLGWTGGDCSGTGPCTIDVTADVTIQATFALDNSLIVTLAGNGTGGVTSNPAGIDCGSDCDEAYAPDTVVTLTAAATGDSTFTGWSGVCTGVSTCVVTVDAAKLVTATFTLAQHTVTVSTGGSGEGTVSSNPAGITCPGDCTQAYDSGTDVTLTPTATTGVFTGWSGDCSGLTCVLDMTADRNVTANFLSITVTGVSSPTTNGIYKAGTTIPVQVTFSQNVTVTGTPTLSLNTTPGATAAYSGGSGSTILTFDYVIAAGQASSDLDYTTTTALTGGTITDGAGHNATLTLPAPGAAGSLGANKALVIDAVAPVVSAVLGIAAYNGASATATWTITDVHPGSTACSFTAGTGALNSCSNTGVSISGMSEGAHTLLVTHTDTAGNVGTQTLSFVVDTTAPVVSTITGVGAYGTTATQSLSYTLTETNPGTTTCTMTTGTGTLGTCSNTGVNYTALSEGAHTVTVSHTDLAGLTSTLRQISWIVDTVNPVVNAITGPAAFASSTSANLSFTVTEANAGTTTCVQTVGTGTAGTCNNTTAAFTALSEGNHTITITHTDLAGRTNARTYSWVVDTIAPVIGTITGPATPTPLATADLSWTLTEANPRTTSSCSITNGGTQASCNATSAQYTQVPGIAHVFSVTHTDLAGNVSAAKTFSWTVINSIAFVTSVSGNADLKSWADSGNQGGLAGADAVCRQRAIQGGLPNSGEFVAWLSTSTSDAYCRVHGLTGTVATKCGQAVLPTGAGPWVRTDGKPFMGALSATTQPHFTPPILTEMNTVLAGATTGFGKILLTNTDNFTNSTRNPTATCADWSNSSLTDIIEIGASGSVPLWSEGPTASCSSTMNLVCVQKGVAAPLAPFAQPGKRTFVTSVTGTGDMATWTDSGGVGGLPGADSICRARAAAGGLANAPAFKAWLSTSTQTASSRITSAGPWINGDGIVIAATKADLQDGSIASTITHNEFGVIEFDAAWTGTLPTGAASSNTCTGWVAGGSVGTVSQWGMTTERWTNHTTNSCTALNALYCFED